MNKTFYLISVLTFALVLNAFGQKQTIALTFTAQYQSQYVMLDSIYIENLTQGGDTILYASDTVLVLDFVTGIATNPALNTGFRVSQNHPNPFAEQTTISIFLPEADHLQVSAVNLLGQKVAFFENSLDAGNHSFIFYPGDDKYYILSATANGSTKTIKMVCMNNHSVNQVSFNYQGPDKNQTNYKSTQEINDFGYSFGDHLRFSGFAKNLWNIVGSDVIESTPLGNENYLFDIIEGIPCPGTPTVIYEGQSYNTLQFGTQCWLKENLNVGTMINAVNMQTNNGQIEKYCYDNDPVNCAIYGGLYQWNEMMQYSSTSGVQGICPTNWHLPIDDEWTILTDILEGEIVAGGKMKTTGTVESLTSLWYEPNTGATNSSGFSALPGGYYNYILSDFLYMGYNGRFWTSYHWQMVPESRTLSYNDAQLFSPGYENTFGFSVRCVKNQEGMPSLLTSAVTNISQNTAMCGGNITSQGFSVSERGVCWSTIPNPKIEDSHTSDGTGTGLFISSLTGLMPITPYYVRAYATTYTGTAYGNQVNFITLPVGPGGEPCPGSPTVTYEGQSYSTVQIGTQCWFQDNLNVGIMIDGTIEQTNNNLKEKYCYNNDQENCTTYGGLYQWNEVMQYTGLPGGQGICPPSWHIPTNAEWTILTDFLGGENIAGGKMKAEGTIEAGTGLWYAPNTGATNSSGFNSLPVGFYIYEYFYQIGHINYLWSSTVSYNDEVRYRSLDHYYATIEDDKFPKYYGLSVRCLKNQEDIPTVSTTAVTNITQIAAASGGNVYYQGNSAVIIRGVCWSTSENPTIADNHTSNGSGEGIFISSVNGLIPSTQYYIRAYATNSAGTGYGTQICFNTLSVGGAGEPCPGAPTITFQGQTYNTIQVGDQCWMKENLNWQTGNSWCFNNNLADCYTYGRLYDWETIMNGASSSNGVPSGVQGICPTGWHIPSDAEWTNLTDFLGGLPIAGGKMKEYGTTHWNEPNTGATNESGFTALPGGYRNSIGWFEDLGVAGKWWSSTEYNINSAWIRWMGYNGTNVISYNYYKTFGHSVRCLRD